LPPVAAGAILKDVGVLVKMAGVLVVEMVKM